MIVFSLLRRSSLALKSFTISSLEILEREGRYVRVSEAAAAEAAATLKLAKGL